MNECPALGHGYRGGRVDISGFYGHMGHLAALAVGQSPTWVGAARAPGFVVPLVALILAPASADATPRIARVLPRALWETQSPAWSHSRWRFTRSVRHMVKLPAAVRSWVHPSPAVAVLTATVLVTSCSLGSSVSSSSVSSSSTRETGPVPAGTLVLGCNNALGHRALSQASDLHLGPLSYAGAAALTAMSPTEYLGSPPSPDASGLYFYKVGATVRAGHTVDVSMDSTGRVMVVGPKGAPAMSVRYQACRDRDTVWVGGFVVKGEPTACAELTYRTDGGPSRSVRVSLFNHSC